MYKGKSILITGGTGSLGKALTKHIIENFKDIKKLVIFSRDEQKQFVMAQEFPESKMRGIMPMWAEISTMSINMESVDEASIVMDEEFINNYDLLIEMRNYLDSLNLDPLVIQKIIDIIKKYN